MVKSKKANRKISKLWMYSLIVAAVLLLAGVLSYIFIVSKPTNHQAELASQTEKMGYDAYASINKDDIESRGLLWEVAFYPEQIPIAALVRIDSVDGGRNYSPIYERYVVAETYGKMTVLEVYKGDVQPGQGLMYSRGGGIITAQEYSNALNAPGSKETYLHGFRPSEKKYVKEYIVDDIDVEVGEKYLAFLTPQSSKDGKYHEYAINGAQYGFRKAKGSGTDVLILKSGTGEWVSPSSVLKQN